MRLVVAGLALAACGCSASTTAPSDGGAGADATAAAPKTAAAKSETPSFAADLARVCSDGLGFPGLPAYRRGTESVHPTVLMNKGDSTWSQNTPLDGDYPRGWILGYTDNIKKTELVACYERLAAAPAGKTCAMKDDKTDEQFTITMYNTTYRLRVLEARTGKTVLNYRGRAASTTCPMLTFSSEGEDRTKYYTEARPADYRGVLKKFISS
ncbi:hypothetical protein J5X84_12055 [Streptosporangiaceae bacterium NEAU-GS5]|nr:hypothetical protein [Streptosporangiaceae bacterium NEAU-GS5]